MTDTGCDSPGVVIGLRTIKEQGGDGMESTALVIAVGVAVAAIIGFVFVWARTSAYRRQLDETKAALEGVRGELMAVQLESIEARTRAEQAEPVIAELKSERDTARKEASTAQHRQSEAEKLAELERQALKGIEKRLSDWEQAKAETLTHAKAAVLETATELSNKLLADHKKENDQAKKEAEERISKTTEGLTKNFDVVAKSVKSLADQVLNNQQSVETVRRALSSPGGAGFFAEIGLENTLKSFGLERNRDFAIQHSVVDEADGTRKKPDAMVFLPCDSVLVIDSKASKFVLDLAEAESEEGEEEAYANLSRTMNQHLRDLAGKDYRGAIIENYRAAGRGKEVRRVMNVMYLPNDAALEKLKRADADFDKKAAKAQILLTGPTGLSGLIAFARLEIDLGRQAENQEKIVEATEALLESVGVVLGHTESVGRGIKNAARAFANMTSSANSRLLPRTRALEQLGVRPTNSKPLPKRLPAYQVIDHPVIDGEAEEVSPVEALEDPSLKVHRLKPGGQ